MIKVKVLEENGFGPAMLGLSLNKKQSVENMLDVAEKLCHYDDGHNKFLESINVHLLIMATRDFWSQFDTYRIGVTKQSQSTMHTITKKYLNQDNFDKEIPQSYLDFLNNLVDQHDLVNLKRYLPEGFYQIRQVCLNYKVLKNIYKQRKNHKLQEWRNFVEKVLNQLEFPHFISTDFKSCNETEEKAQKYIEPYITVKWE